MIKEERRKIETNDQLVEFVHVSSTVRTQHYRHSLVNLWTPIDQYFSITKIFT